MDTTNTADAVSTPTLEEDLRRQVSCLQTEVYATRRSIRTAHDLLQEALNELDTDQAEQMAEFLNENQSIFDDFKVKKTWRVQFTGYVEVEATDEDEACDLVSNDLSIRYEGDDIEVEVIEATEGY
jgi:hypothetical protein